MNSNKKRHFLQEGERWLRTLEYVQQENIYLKKLLADIIKNGMDNKLLDQVEYYHNQFIDKDTLLQFLHQDVIRQGKQVEIHESENAEVQDNRLQKRQDKLRIDMDRMENEFSKLKYSFNNYLASTL